MASFSRRIIAAALGKSHISSNAKVSWKAFVGSNVEISPGAVVRAFARLENDVTLRQGSLVASHAVLSRVDVGERSFLDYGVIITGRGEGTITIGHDTYVGIYNVLDWSEEIRIGNFVHIGGPSTGLWTHTSVRQARAGLIIADSSKRETGKIEIGDNCYIGGNCTIYPGVRIGEGAVVAPNSAVSEDVSPFTMVGGVPARVIKHLGPPC
jgi:acetyltransferase-like isoleucine patch superfamily enzyme